MKKQILIFIVLLLFSISSQAHTKHTEKMCNFRPAYFDHNNSLGIIILGSKLIDAPLRKGLISVFEHYEKYTVLEKGNELFTDCSIYSEPELIVNYTKKASDEDFLRHLKR